MITSSSKLKLEKKKAKFFIPVYLHALITVSDSSTFTSMSNALYISLIISEFNFFLAKNFDFCKISFYNTTLIKKIINENYHKENYNYIDHQKERISKYY